MKSADTISRMIETAMVWSAVDNSALYQFGSTGIIRDETHRSDLLHELSKIISGAGMDEPMMIGELFELKALRTYITCK